MILNSTEIKREDGVFRVEQINNYDNHSVRISHLKWETKQNGVMALGFARQKPKKVLKVVPENIIKVRNGNEAKRTYLNAVSSLNAGKKAKEIEAFKTEDNFFKKMTREDIANKIVRLREKEGQTYGAIGEILFMDTGREFPSASVSNIYMGECARLGKKPVTKVDSIKKKKRNEEKAESKKRTAKKSADIKKAQPIIVSLRDIEKPTKWTIIRDILKKDYNIELSLFTIKNAYYRAKGIVKEREEWSIEQIKKENKIDDETWANLEEVIFKLREKNWYKYKDISDEIFYRTNKKIGSRNLSFVYRDICRRKGILPISSFQTDKKGLRSPIRK